MCLNKVINLSFNEVFYEVRIANGVITKITKFYGASQIEKELVYSELPREVQLAVVEAVIDDNDDQS